MWQFMFLALPIIAQLLNESLEHLGGSDVSIQEEDSYEDMLHGCLCLNEETLQAHTEMNATYTAILVPGQNMADNVYDFILQLSVGQKVCISLIPGMCFSFNAFLLTHQQKKTAGTKTFQHSSAENLCIGQ